MNDSTVIVRKKSVAASKTSSNKHTSPDKSAFAGEFTLQTLLDYNQKRLQAFKQRPLFALIQDGTLADVTKRQVFLNSMQIWTEGNQTLLFARQGTCHDPEFQHVFLKHLQEEVGHDDLYNARPESKTGFRDALMTAITTWFLHQMFVLDNIEKAAIIHLVIESASDEYHQIAKPHLLKYLNDAYFEAHEADVQHVAMGVELLSGYNSKVYRRLQTVVADAWDMLTAMVDRVAYLVNGA